jgi:hypothetical protein
MKMFNDKPYFIYSGSNTLGLVSWEKGVWKAGVLDANSFSSGGYDNGYKPSLTIDANGNLHVSYFARLDNGRYGLKYGTNAGGAWRFRTPLLHFNYDVSYYSVQAGEWSGIGVDPAGKIHIAYHKRDYIEYLFLLYRVLFSELPYLVAFSGTLPGGALPPGFFMRSFGIQGRKQASPPAGSRRTSPVRTP